MAYKFSKIQLTIIFLSKGCVKDCVYLLSNIINLISEFL